MMTTRNYTRIIRGGWVIVLISTLLAGIGVGVLSITKQPVYVATSTLAVSTCVAVENSPVCDPVGGMSFAIQRANIYEKTGTSLPVLRRALELTDVTSKRSTLRDHTSVAQTADSPIIDVTATWHHAGGAAEIANAMSVALVEYARGSVDRFESEMTTVDFSVINEATVPSEPVDDTVQTVALAMTLGLLVGMLIALLRFHLDKRVKDREEAENETGLPVLATIENKTTRPRRSTPTATDTEPFRRLSVATTSRLSTASFQTLLIASPDNSDSSGQVADGLASAMAQTGANVAVAHLDSRDIQIVRGESLVGVGAGTAIRSPRIATASSPGGTPVEPLATLGSPMPGPNWLNEVVEEIRGTVDIVIVDATPVLQGADSLSASRLADGVILVVDLGKTQLGDLRECVRSFELVGTKPLGIAILT